MAGSDHELPEPAHQSREQPASEESLAPAFRLAPIGIALCQLETGAIIETSDAFLKLVGVSREDALNRTFVELGLVADRKSLERLVASLLAHGVHREELPLRRETDAGTRTVLLDAHLITNAGACCMLALLRDVTASLDAESLASATRQFAEQVVASAQEGILVIDELRRIRVWNLFMEQLTGHAARDVAGMHATEVFGDQRLPGFSSLLARGLAGETLHAPDSFVAMPERQREFWVSCRIAPVFDRNGTARGAIVTMRDITLRKRLEQRLINIVEREHQRIGQDLHDDLGQHLTAISLTVDAVRRRTPEMPGRSREDLTHISQLLEDMHLNIRNIVHGLQPVAPHAHGLMDALDILAHSDVASPGTRVSFHCPRPVLVENQTVAMQIYRIAKEAVNNAVKHAGAPNIRIGLSLRRAHIVLEVADDGSGVPTHKLALCKGAGLSIMRYRAESIGAQFDIQQRKPQGTVVRCTVRPCGAALTDE